MTTIDYGEEPKPITLNIEHEDYEPSYMNGKWVVLAGDVINYTKYLGEPKQIVVVLERVEE